MFEVIVDGTTLEIPSLVTFTVFAGDVVPVCRLPKSVAAMLNDADRAMAKTWTLPTAPGCGVPTSAGALLAKAT